MPGSSQVKGPAFFFSPRFPAGNCVKVSGGFLYKLPSNLGRFQRFPFQGGTDINYTIEGNSNNMVRQNSYPVGYGEIKGYGVVLP